MKICLKCNLPRELLEFRKNERTCKSCARELARRWKQNNQDKVKACRERYLSECKEKVRESRHKTYLKNKRIENLNSRLWKKLNSDRHAALQSKRRSLKLHATPSWASLEKIAEIYKQRRLVSEVTGVEHHVDHVIPLKGKNVCGLHVETNLKIVPATENMKKSNKLLETEWLTNYTISTWQSNATMRFVPGCTTTGGSCLGDKAYSFATKKEMPGPRAEDTALTSSLSTQLTTHSRRRLRSRRVMYGGGTTTLDYVQRGKAKLKHGDYYELNLNNGDRFYIIKNVRKLRQESLVACQPNGRRGKEGSCKESRRDP
jgi:hypothetical protein